MIEELFPRSTGTPEQWAALREPFPAEMVQTRPGGGGHLSYVSHGDVTDRLLQVDSAYRFVPLVDSDQRPIVVLDGLAHGDNVGVWGLLELLGSSVVEFCSGKDLMDAYSRCLCRAAMRRGVALDLWRGDIPAGDVRKEANAMTVPRSWAKVREWYDKNGGEKAWQLAEALLRAASYHLYGETDGKKLTPDQRKVMLQKSAGVVVWLAENENTPIGSTPDKDHYAKAWATQLDGFVLEVPDAPKDEELTDEEAEIERLAQAALDLESGAA